MQNKRLYTPSAWVKAQIQNGATIHRLCNVMNPKHSMRAILCSLFSRTTCIYLERISVELATEKPNGQKKI